MHLAIISFFYIILACTWNLLAGFTGQFSLAHNAFAAVGGYTSALLAVNLGVPPLYGIFIGGVSAMVTSYLIGQLTLKMRRIYLAIATWAFAGSLELFIRMEYEWTRGDLGLHAPRLFLTASKVPYYYVGFAMMAVMVAIMYKIVAGRIGLYMRAIREDEEAASAMGVDTVKWKKFVFSITGLFVGMAGAFKAHYVGLISPVFIRFDFMALIIMMVILGGFGDFFGPIIGAPIVEVLMEYFRVYGQIRLVLFAAVIILVARFFREGLMGLFQSIYARLHKR
ncbi:MAG: branched-chain amino acid ABC transporter permease [Candidatus Geothermarchaeales archaeon]